MNRPHSAWTNDLPRAEGFYWRKDDYHPEGQVVEVKEIAPMNGDDEKQPYFMFFTTEATEGLMCKHHTVWWQGPLVPNP